MKLFFTGMVQVFFVAMNTYFISREFWQGVLVCGFTISLIWSWNVKRIVFGDFNDRLLYSFGAATGSLLGMVLSKYILR